jgi:hypothetical protein
MDPVLLPTFAMTVISNSAIDAFLSLSLPTIIVVVIGISSAIAIITHCVLVPWVAGRDGSKMVGFQSEVVALIGLAFGLLISFNAVSVWQTADTAKMAIMREAAALQTFFYELEVLPAPQNEEGQALLRQYVDHVRLIEWPLLMKSQALSDRPDSQKQLVAFSRTHGHDAMNTALTSAIDQRILRIQMSLYRISRARWTVVVMLAILLILSMGLLHAQHRRSRAVGLAFVAIAIGTCFVILFAHGRPFVGTNALEPVELNELAAKLAAG